MISSAWHPDIHSAFMAARANRHNVFPSPADWRDHWIYFVLLDRFNNPDAAPHSTPWDGTHDTFQGGTFNGVRAQLDYLQALGVGAIWFSPVLKNCAYDRHSYHGYGIQNFIAIEPRFASDPMAAAHNPAIAERELRHLIDAAHARGMYVIFDIVLNHTGNVFSYAAANGDVAEMPWQEHGPAVIHWHDSDGQPRLDWTEAPTDPPMDATIWPAELRNNIYFRRQGNAFSRPGNPSEHAGDFYSLKEFVTELALPDPNYGNYYPVRDTLIRCYQYIIAKFDVDGFRIDTLKFIEPEFALMFGNAIREFALSIGKKNFFTFGEIYDDEAVVERFIGRDTRIGGDMIGVDAALDFPLFFRLPSMAKGMSPPRDVIAMYERRKQLQQTQISSHGDAGQYFVTFLDNHDQPTRFYYVDPSNPTRFDAQLLLGLGCLFTLQGIPCLYYGTEQGLHGANACSEAVREALWGKDNAFDRQHPFFGAVQQLSEVRANHPALRYGRQYFRPISGNGIDFGLSSYQPGVLAFSRILNDQEVLVLANADIQNTFMGEVIVDYALNPLGSSFTLVYSNLRFAGDMSSVSEKLINTIDIISFDGNHSTGPARALAVGLRPMEFQIWARA